MVHHAEIKQQLVNVLFLKQLWTLTIIVMSFVQYNISLSHSVLDNIKYLIAASLLCNSLDVIWVSGCKFV